MDIINMKGKWERITETLDKGDEVAFLKDLALPGFQTFAVEGVTYKQSGRGQIVDRVRIAGDYIPSHELRRLVFSVETDDTKTSDQKL